MKEAQKCAAVEPLLYDYLNGSLDAGEAQLVAQHLGRCGKCKLELQRWRTFDQVASNLPPAHAPEVPPELTQRIMEAVAQEAALERAEAPFAAFRARKLPMLIALVAFGSIGGMYLVRPLQSASTWLERFTGSAATAVSTWSAAPTPYWLLFSLWALAGLLLCYAVLLGCARYVSKRHLRVG